MKDLKCFTVICLDETGSKHSIGVMAADEFSARHCAENSFLEGKHLKVKATECFECEEI